LTTFFANDHKYVQVGSGYVIELLPGTGPDTKEIIRNPQHCKLRTNAAAAVIN
jgi:hypothetical protein